MRFPAATAFDDFGEPGSEDAAMGVLEEAALRPLASPLHGESADDEIVDACGRCVERNRERGRI